MPDFAGSYFFVPNQSRQDREAGSIGRCPSGRPEGVRPQIEDGSGPGLPTAVRLGIGGVKFVKDAIVFVENEHMAVARRSRPTFNLRIRGYRVRPGIALVGIIKRDNHFLLSPRYDIIRDSDGTAIPGAGPKIRVKTRG
jgi:hypothetical protein